ncbi:MAG: matrixin family metalloprotease [Patescibacteria group bacterium]
MKKILLGVLIGTVVVILTFGVAYALPSVPGIEKAKEKSPAIDDETRSVVAPPHFVFPQLSENELTKIIFIRYAPGVKPLCDKDGICEPKENWKNCPDDCKKEEEPTTGCFAFLSGSKPKWNWVEDYYYSSGLGTTSTWATDVWDAASSATIFGNGIDGAGQWGNYDYKNSIVFGDYSDPNVIAVTAIWFRGKNIYEYDILFDEDYFPGSVDLDTVALHEFGHGAGLGDLYDTACIDEVMYGYYTDIKTTLGSGDITGIQTLYGI